MKKSTTIRVKPSTKAKIYRLGKITDSFDDVLQNLLGETWHFDALKRAQNETIESLEKFKKNPRENTWEIINSVHSLLSVLNDFIAHVEKRSA
jgi:hypothetical protein